MKSPFIPLATCACKFVAPDGMSPSSADFHRAHRDAHLSAFPSCGQPTRDNLDFFVRLAERGAFVAPIPQPEVTS